jgi:hypothetical protein
MQVANAHALISSTVDNYLTVANSVSLLVQSNVDKYLEAANANVLIQNTVDNYLQVANASPFLVQNDVDRYLEVANTNVFLQQADVDQYLQVANTSVFLQQADVSNFLVQGDVDKYLEAANASLLISNTVDQYLQVSNTASFLVQDNVDKYLEAANASVLIQNTVDQYLQVANTGPFLTIGDFDHYLAVANASSLISATVSEVQTSFTLAVDTVLHGSLNDRFDKYFETANTTLFLTPNKVLTSNTVTVTNVGGNIVLSTVPTTLDTLGTGTSLVTGFINNTLQQKTISAGSNMRFTEAGGDIELQSFIPGYKYYSSLSISNSEYVMY